MIHIKALFAAIFFCLVIATCAPFILIGFLFDEKVRRMEEEENEEKEEPVFKGLKFFTTDKVD